MEVEVFADASNAAVVRVPGRKHPGLVLQGDTLSILNELAIESAAAIASGNTTEAMAALRELSDRLGDFKKIYEEALEREGLPTPY
jgi:hypothetical protein